MLSTAAPAGDHNQRPIFQSAEHWLEHYEHSVSYGLNPFPPLTYDELILADAHGILELKPYRHWIPGVRDLPHLGLSPNFGRDHEPHDEFEKETFLASLKSDPQFASAVFNLIQGEG